MNQDQFNLLVTMWIALAVAFVPVQLAITPAYGRHSKARWGPTMDQRTGWIVMELVSPVALLLPFFWSGWDQGIAVAVFASVWVLHYVNRSIVFPLSMNVRGKTMPLAIVAMAILFNIVNGLANGYYLARGWGAYDVSWLYDPRFIAGMAVFAFGAAINIWSDRHLVRLRDGKSPGHYSIPRHGLFRLVSCPNHLGEIIEWTGFAIACWNLPALAFLVWTAANLGPRALAHHRWYHQEFPDYPKTRKALIPFLL